MSQTPPSLSVCVLTMSSGTFHEAFDLANEDERSRKGKMIRGRMMEEVIFSTLILLPLLRVALFKI